MAGETVAAPTPEPDFGLEPAMLQKLKEIAPTINKQVDDMFDVHVNKKQKRLNRKPSMHPYPRMPIYPRPSDDSDVGYTQHHYHPMLRVVVGGVRGNGFGLDFLRATVDQIMTLLENH
eukprot:9134297-Pyramimonas_sp.AAC.1